MGFFKNWFKSTPSVCDSILEEFRRIADIYPDDLEDDTVDQNVELFLATMKAIAANAYLYQVSQGISPEELAEKGGYTVEDFKYYVDNISSLTLDNVFKILVILEAPFHIRFESFENIEYQQHIQGEES